MKSPSLGATVVVSSTVSDSHMWNLVFLQLLIEELGHNVINLGACVPDALLLDQCRDTRPDLIVISSVNGHGVNDGLRLAPLIRACSELSGTPLVIGGKLGVDGIGNVTGRDRLEQAGFDRVYDESELAAFGDYLARLSAMAVS
jgi:methylaspartate mutase sigma subunit